MNSLATITELSAQVEHRIRQRRPRCALDVEAVLGGAVLVQLCGRERGRDIDARDMVGRHTVGPQLGQQHRTEPVDRHGCDERDIDSEPTARTRRVERGAAQGRRDTTVRIDDKIHQSLTDDHDHGHIMTKTRWFGTG